nr:uncharacterized protein LOC113698213 [Coffea arabica]
MDLKTIFQSGRLARMIVLVRKRTLHGSWRTAMISERRLEHLGGIHSDRARAFHGNAHVLPCVHSLVPIQTAKAAGRGIGLMANKTGRADEDGEVETAGCEMKKVRGRRNKRTPRCQGYNHIGFQGCPSPLSFLSSIHLQLFPFFPGR